MTHEHCKKAMKLVGELRVLMPTCTGAFTMVMVQTPVGNVHNGDTVLVMCGSMIILGKVALLVLGQPEGEGDGVYFLQLAHFQKGPKNLWRRTGAASYLPLTSYLCSVPSISCEAGLFPVIPFRYRKRV